MVLQHASPSLRARAASTNPDLLALTAPRTIDAVSFPPPTPPAAAAPTEPSSSSSSSPQACTHSRSSVFPRGTVFHAVELPAPRAAAEPPTRRGPHRRRPGRARGCRLRGRSESLASPGQGKHCDTSLTGLQRISERLWGDGITTLQWHFQTALIPITTPLLTPPPRSGRELCLLNIYSVCTVFLQPHAAHASLRVGTCGDHPIPGHCRPHHCLSLCRGRDGAAGPPRGTRQHSGNSRRSTLAPAARLPGGELCVTQRKGFPMKPCCPDPQTRWSTEETTAHRDGDCPPAPAGPGRSDRRHRGHCTTA